MPRNPPPKREKQRAPGAKLTDELRTEVVTRLAMYDTIGQIREWLIEEHGIDVSHEAISAYNAGTNHSKVMSKRWIDLFHKVREEWLAEMAREPIANRAWRLRRLGELFTVAKAAGDIEEARKALEQAAKETGNVYTNIAKVQGSILPGQLADDRTPEEARNMLADRLREAMERHQAKAAPTAH